MYNVMGPTQRLEHAMKKSTCLAVSNQPPSQPMFDLMLVLCTQQGTLTNMSPNLEDCLDFDMDYPGNDVGSSSATDVVGCQRSCQERQGCSHFTIFTGPAQVAGSRATTPAESPEIWRGTPLSAGRAIAEETKYR